MGGVPVRRRRHSRPETKWKPSQEQVAEIVAKYFAFVPDDFECIRTKTVGQAVAAAIGVIWSPTLAMQVRRALIAMGGRLVEFNGKHLVKRIRPQHFDRAEAVALSMRLRERKTPPRGMANVG
jgi:hypothetical protein